MLFLLLSLFAYEEEPKNPLAVDDDGYGYSEFDGDCDDSDGTIYEVAAKEDSKRDCMKDSDGDGYEDML